MCVCDAALLRKQMQLAWNDEAVFSAVHTSGEAELLQAQMLAVAPRQESRQRGQDLQSKNKA